MKSFLVAIFMALLSTAAFADWPLDRMNKHIEATNWILDNQCSGTTIDAKNRIILTNWHCIRTSLGRENGPNYAPGDVFVSQRKYQDFSIVKIVTYAAVVLDANPKLDVAILKIRDNSVVLTDEALPAKTDTLQRGQKVYLVGNPEMQDNTLVVGYISSPSRMLNIEGYSRRYFQVSGGLTGGASGGAVYNEDGEFIGITTAGSPRATYIGFAVPNSAIRELLTSSPFLNSK